MTDTKPRGAGANPQAIARLMREAAQRAIQPVCTCANNETPQTRAAWWERFRDGGPAWKEQQS